MGLIIRCLWGFFLIMLQLSELAPEDLWLPSPKGYYRERKAFLILPFSIPVLWSPFRCLPFWLPPFSCQELLPSNLPRSFPNCSPHLCPPSSDPESTDLRAGACAELRELWGRPLPFRLYLGTEMGKWCCGRNFYLQTRLFRPLHCPASIPTPLRKG